MKIWILKDSEQLPLAPGAKQMRAGMLAETLAGRGHGVRWFCSTFHHRAKTLYAEADKTITLPTGVVVQMLHAGTYQRNLSPARILHHRRLAKRWREHAERSDETPDLILAAYPIIEWVREALAYAGPRGIPVVVDVRDQWPDTFADYAPPALKPLVRLGAALFYPYVGRILREAECLTSMSTNVLRWAIRKSGRSDGDRCRVFYLGTELSEGGAIARTISPPGAPVRVSFLGSLGHTADVLTIAGAATLLTNHGAPLRFTIAGDGEMMQALRTLQGSPERFALPGWMDTEAARALLCDTDIALLTGHNEAMPNKFFDYLAAGLPIVCSLRGECREYVEAHGLGRTCPSGDVPALAEAIRMVAADLSRYRAALAQVPPAHYAKHAIYTAFAEFLEAVLRG